MKLSAPIFILKQRAKALARREKIPLSRALDRIATREGFGAWSLLSSAASASERPTKTLLSQIAPGDLVLVGSRPRQGKTLLGLGLAIEAMKRGGRAAFFTLEFTRADVARCFTALEEDLGSFGDRFLVDDSDEISAGYVAARLASAPPGTLVVLDYLQILDQKRGHAGLMEQVRRLKTFARERRVIVVFLSQIDRAYERSRRPFPELRDVRLPNPLDLGLFDRACFLNAGRISVAH
jgi:replicative DNA helicase